MREFQHNPCGDPSLAIQIGQRIACAGALPVGLEPQNRVPKQAMDPEEAKKISDRMRHKYI